MYGLLQWIYGVVLNYGWAIILMTVLIKIVLAPLTIKSYRSMQMIQALSPKVNAIRAGHAADPKKAQSRDYAPL